MNRIGLARRIVLWLLAIGWIPVAAEVSLKSLFPIEGHFESTIPIIRYLEFIALPLTFLALLAVLDKAANATVRLFQNNKIQKQYGMRELGSNCK